MMETFAYTLNHEVVPIHAIFHSLILPLLLLVLLHLRAHYYLLVLLLGDRCFRLRCISFISLFMCYNQTCFLI